MDLTVFDELSSNITEFVAPAKEIRVTDPESTRVAIAAAKEIKEYINRIETKRKELVGPLNAQVKAINDYCHQLKGPLEAVDTHVRAQLNAFAAEQEKFKRAELARIEAERVEAERLARIERERIEEELRLKQEAEFEAHAEAAQMFGVEGGDIDKAHAELQAKQDAEEAEIKAKLAMEASIAAGQVKQKQFDADQTQIKNTRGTMNVRILDINLIPKEFLIITPNEKALLAVGKAGMKVPGVEFYETYSVAIGRTTRIPKLG